MTKNKRITSGIASWHESERPRERLIERGAEALTDAELVAIILRVGVQGMSAVEMGRSLLSQFGSLRAMTEAPLSALLDIKGLKTAKAAQLTAAMEIARRVGKDNSSDNRLRVNNSNQVSDYLRNCLRSLPEEHFRVLYFNRQNRLLQDSLIAQGDVHSVSVSLRQIVVRALQLNASALIAAHNHPSGTPTPSIADRELTKNLIAATRLLGINVLDHLIVTNTETYSFADNGLLAKLESECNAPRPVKRRATRKK